MPASPLANVCNAGCRLRQPQRILACNHQPRCSGGRRTCKMARDCRHDSAKRAQDQSLADVQVEANKDQCLPRRAQSLHRFLLEHLSRQLGSEAAQLQEPQSEGQRLDSRGTAAADARGAFEMQVQHRTQSLSGDGEPSTRTTSTFQARSDPCPARSPHSCEAFLPLCWSSASQTRTAQGLSRLWNFPLQRSQQPQISRHLSLLLTVWAPHHGMAGAGAAAVPQLLEAAWHTQGWRYWAPAASLAAWS